MSFQIQALFLFPPYCLHNYQRSISDWTWLC